MDKDKLGFWGLSALVFGMMVGAGIFNIPQNMAAGAGLGAVVVSWVITAAGMLLPVGTFKSLADTSHSTACIYEYARKGFGSYVGFNVAWGYWLCTAFANVAYAVMLNDTFGAFFPSLLRHGWSTVAFGGALIWVMYFIVARGLRTAKRMNNFLTVLKIVSILLIIVLMALMWHSGIFYSDVWGRMGDIGSIGTQIKSTMLVTLWCFIGIEGAVMMSGRARNKKDVGKAGVTGFIAAWVLYLLVSVLCFGVMTRAELAGLEDPSVAYLLKDTIGAWAYWFVIISVIVSLLGGWVAWTLVCAEVPYEAACEDVLPRRFRKLNANGMPAYGLMVSSVVMTLFLALVVLADDVYLAALSITGMMILPAYLCSGLYMCKSGTGIRNKLLGVGCTLFCLWMIYAGGLRLLMLTSLFYLAGTFFYVKARRESHARIFSAWERILFLVFVICAAVSLVLIYKYGTAVI